MSELRGFRPHQVIGYEYVPPNLLINGGFETWQRGAGPFIFSPVTNGITADEWRSAAAGVSGNCQYDRSTLAKVGTYCLRITPDPARQSNVQQGVESYKSLAGLTLTFSCWVKSSAAAVLYVADYDGSWVFSVSPYSSGSGDWERLTVVRTVRDGLAYPAASDPPHLFPLMVGTTSAVLGSVLYVDGATCVVGNYPEGVPFVPLNPAEDMDRCERFYEQLYINMSASGSTSTWYGSIPMVPKPSVPTITPTGTVLTGNATGIVTTPTSDMIHYGMTRSAVVGYGGITSTLIAAVP